MIDTLADLKSAIEELQKIRKTDTKQNEFLDQVLRDILANYGYQTCVNCRDITPSCYGERCSYCADKARRVEESDEHSYRTRHE